jgi:hypothetical protein
MGTITPALVPPAGLCPADPAGKERTQTADDVFFFVHVALHSLSVYIFCQENIMWSERRQQIRLKRYFFLLKRYFLPSTVVFFYRPDDMQGNKKIARPRSDGSKHEPGFETNSSNLFNNLFQI